MSWDIFVQDLPDVDDVSQIPDDFVPRPLGRRSDVIEAVRRAVPGANFSDPAWGRIDGPGFSIEVNLGDSEELGSFALHVRGADMAAGVVADILDELGYRALDPQSDSGFFSRAHAVESLRAWRSYRDTVMRATPPSP